MSLYLSIKDQNQILALFKDTNVRNEHEKISL